MQLYVGVTDNEWFKFAASIYPDEVNFWKPGGQGFGAIEPGAPFLFKLHSPLNKIAGGGFFVRSERLPLSLAWDAFGTKNGASDYHILLQKINKLSHRQNEDPTVGCIILNDPFFFPEEQWIDTPTSFSSNIVSGKTYDMSEGDGALLWSEVMQRLNSFKIAVGADNFFPGYGREYLTRSRLGQGAFQILVTSAYNRNCAISGEKALPVLQAAHIKPYSEQGPNMVKNGLLLRSDLHILFDRGYITVTPEYKIEVSNKIKEKFHNGKHYYAFHGKELLTLPASSEEKPDIEFIRWHNDYIYEKKLYLKLGAPSKK